MLVRIQGKDLEFVELLPGESRVQAAERLGCPPTTLHEVTETDNDSARYELYKRAQESGGPCPVCGWTEGDGVKPCFYGKNLGLVNHENADPKALTPPAIRAAWEAYENQVLAMLPEILHDGMHHFTGVFAKSWGHTARDKDTTLNGSYLVKPWWIPAEYDPDNPARQNRNGYPFVIKREDGLYFYTLQPAHGSCRGIVEWEGPYHPKCHTCGVEVRMWEYGVDYDVG